MTDSIYATIDTPATQKIKDLAASTSAAKISDILKSPFFQLYCELVQASTISSGREAMFASFNKLRSRHSPEVKAMIDLTGMEDGHIFVQVLLRTILNCLLTTVVELCTKNSAEQNDFVSAREQGILYYIAGYLIKKLSEKEGAESIVETASVTPSTESTFKTQHDKWTKQVNRGGLKMASDDMFLLARSMECVIRKTVDMDSLKKDTFCRTTAKELVMEDFMVKHYWHKLSAGTSKSLALLEFVVGKFLTMRGFAVTRVLKQKIMKKTGTAKQKALRKALKDKTN